MSTVPPRFIMTVGLPGVGKSTWISGTYEILEDGRAPYIVSSDATLELLGARFDMTYNEMFGDFTYSFAERMNFKIARHLFGRGDHVIWDQTNLTAKSRAKKLAIVPPHYHRTCLYFITPSDHAARLAQRPGKNIPQSVLDKMQATLEVPTYSEGFHEIYGVDNVN